MNAMPAMSGLKRPVLIETAAGRVPANVAALGTAETKVLPVTPSRSPSNARVVAALREIAATVVPPMIVLVALLLVWQLATSAPGGGGEPSTSRPRRGRGTLPPRLSMRATSSWPV